MFCHSTTITTVHPSQHIHLEQVVHRKQKESATSSIHFGTMPYIIDRFEQVIHRKQEKNTSSNFINFDFDKVFHRKQKEYTDPRSVIQAFLQSFGMLQLMNIIQDNIVPQERKYLTERKLFGYY